MNTNNPPLADLESNIPVISSTEKNPEPSEEQNLKNEEIFTINENRKTNMKTHYEWIPENFPPPKEIHGEVGDPQNIIDSNQRHKHTANYVVHSIQEDPRAYWKAMNCQFSDEWSKATQTKL
ncbi:hypothetical protein O181_052615 [Austropuccinia psidii MF-1]|uniref:Uncharacterized protein n=1 Tax=Austropuccinia psidii MF-1 TaxID=1389203 RepID=A0A9Q3E598_9BASI|nr:hypothetical protein [Austropuccinia psidii MF-1]